jgi:PEP-CTERM motif-containing protein
MRRATACGVVVGVLAVFTAMPSAAQAVEGFWASIAAGAAGAAQPSDYTEFWFDSPHGPPIAVTQLSGTTAQAVTGGGTTFFSPAGTPVLLPTSDGYATLTNPDVANGSGGLPKFAGGTQASGAPLTAQPVPETSNSLSIAKGEAAADGSSVLTVGVTDPNGNPLGSGQVTVPDGGWWVIGIGPGEKDVQPPPDPDPIGGGEDPPPEPVPPGGGSGGNTGGGGGPVATPEPATVVLVGLGGLSLAGFRRLRRRD